MLLAYVDESYTAQRYWIVALLCDDTQIVPLTTALDRVVATAAHTYTGISSTAELHGHSLFHAKDDWAPLATMTRARIAIYNDAFDGIAASGAEIILRGVDIPGLNRRYIYPDHPHSNTLQYLLERLDERAEQRSELVLVIADEVDQADQHRRDLWRFQRTSTTGYRARQLLRIVDTIHFAPSKASRLVQAADLIAYLWRRIDSRIEQDARAIRANEALWAKLSGNIVHCHCWYPQ